MSTPVDIPFQQLLAALLDPDTPFPPKFLYRLSDLEGEELDQLERLWPTLPNRRRQALMEDVEELGRRDTLLSFEGLAVLAARDPLPGVRLPAVHTLWEYESLALVSLFLERLKTDDETPVRAAAAGGLGSFVYRGELEEIPAQTLHQIEDELLNVMQGQENALVRQRALESLGFSSREEVPGLILAAYQSGQEDWIASAIFAMGRSANERWQPEVLAMLDHEAPPIRTEAVRAVGELEIHDAVPRLLDLLDDPDDDVRLASIWSLSQLGGDRVREALEQIYAESDDDEEIDFVETALVNLSFTEDMQALPFFDIPEDGLDAGLDEAEELDLLEEDDDED